MAKAKFELARKTSMAEYAIAVYKELHGEDAAVPAGEHGCRSSGNTAPASLDGRRAARPPARPARLCCATFPASPLACRPATLDNAAELEAAKEAVAEQWRRHMDAAGPLIQIVDNGSGAASEAMTEMLSLHTFTPEHLAAAYGVGRDAIEALYDCAKFRFDCGEYDVSAFYLGVYRDLVPPETDRSLRALWGRFAGHVLTTAWDEADRDREMLRGAIAKARMPELEAMQQRTWLLHWSLFVFANHPKGKDNLLDFFLQDTHVAAIQLNAPWLLRYVCAVALTNKKRGNYLRQILRLVAQEAANTGSAGGAPSDPVRAPWAARGRRTDEMRRGSARMSPRAYSLLRAPPFPLTSPLQIVLFLDRLLIHFDFDGATAALTACESVIVTDFFLSYLTSPREFMEAARLFIFETYCRIHQQIDLPALAGKLHMDVDGAERWVVELIRSAALDAKIDSVGRQVIMSVPAPSVYNTVIERTRELTARTRMLADSVEAALSGGGGGGGYGGGGGGDRGERGDRGDRGGGGGYNR